MAMRRHNMQTSVAAPQRGAALVVGMLLLLVLTVVGVTGMSTAVLEQKMAANYRDRDLAFQAAEFALREGERYVQNTVLDASNFDAACNGGMCLPADAANGDIPVWRDTTLNVWSNSGRHRTYQINAAEVRSLPIYIIEWMGYVPPVGSAPTYSPGPGDPQMFRITAVGYGGTDAARVMLQSTYQKEP